MTIRDNKNRIQYEGDMFPSYVLDYLTDYQDINVYYYTPMELLHEQWEGSDHSCEPLAEFIDMIPIFMQATCYDTIVMIKDDRYYLIPYDMEDNDDDKAYQFWGGLLNEVLPGWTLSKE